jgi:sn-glycerol 3-phosphate transport system ATP-binding protein
VFQNYALYPHMSVYDNMAYGLRNRGTPREQIDTKVRAAAELLGITPFLDRKPRALSGGQRQRVAMGRAIVREPKAFLFDEPLSNLDAKLRLAMRIEIRKLHNRLRATSIFVTHDQVEAMTLADQVVVMNAGRIEQAGKPSEVYARPASRFVATFIGAPAMNLIPAKVTASGAAHVEGAGQVGYDAAAFKAPDGAVVEVGIRPEHMVIVAPGSAPEAGSVLRFDRELMEDLGPNRLLHGRIGPHPVTVSVASGTLIPDATHLDLLLPRSEVQLFDAASGVRLGAG